MTLPPFALAHLTALDLPPPALISVAAATGYARVGLRLMPVVPGATSYPLMDDAALMAATRARLAATGIEVADLEIVVLRPETEVASFLPLMEAGALLGARHLLTAGYDPDEGRLAARFAALCDAAAPFGLTADLEFMPWTAVPDLATAARIVGAAARPNGGLLVDALHFDRSANSLDALARVPRGWLHYWQLCDAPAERPTSPEALQQAARAERMFPGEGGIDLAGLARALPADLPVSLEIPMQSRAAEMTPEARARHALACARRVLAQARG